MSDEEDGFELTTIDLPPEAFAKFWDAINNPKPPTKALIDLMKATAPWDTRTKTVLTEERKSNVR